MTDALVETWQPDVDGESAIHTVRPGRRDGAPHVDLSVFDVGSALTSLVATLLTAMAQGHERAAVAWPAEWETTSDLLRSTGSAAAWVRDCLERLGVDAERMTRNLDAAGSDLRAELDPGELSHLTNRSTGQAGPLVDRALARRKR